MGSRVSVVITTHYRNDRLTRAIESALAQTHDPTEVVVVDDSGDAHARPVATTYDVEYVPHERNRGQVAAWNTGLDSTDGDYVQFLDDDDWLDERKIASQLDLIERSPDVGVVYCGLLFEDGRVYRPELQSSESTLAQTLTFHLPAATTSSLLIDRDPLSSAAPLANYEAGTDIPLKIELARRTGFDHLDDCLVYRGVQPDAQGDSMAAANARWRALDEYADLYREFPDEIRRRAVAHTLRMQARIQLRERGWSPTATTKFARAAAVDPDSGSLNVAAVVASLFGNPGYVFGSWILDRVRALRGDAPTIAPTALPSFTYDGERHQAWPAEAVERTGD